MYAFAKCLWLWGGDGTTPAHQVEAMASNTNQGFNVYGVGMAPTHPTPPSI